MQKLTKRSIQTQKKTKSANSKKEDTMKNNIQARVK